MSLRQRLITGRSRRVVVIEEVFPPEEEEEEEGEEEEAEEDEEEEEEEEEEEDDEEQILIDVPDSPRVSLDKSDEEKNYKKAEGGEGDCSCSGSQEDGEWKPGDAEGSFCLICMEAWTNGGEHQVCCLPCGHLYGFSCIKKWLQQRRSSGKCPQCNRTCALKDVRKIFASKIAAVDNEAQKRILYLETKLNSLEQKTASWSKKESQWRKIESDLRSEVSQLLKKMESTTKAGEIKSYVASQEQYILGHKIIREHHGQAPSCSFRHQGDLLIDGGRIFDIDAGRQTLLMARRLPGMGGTFVLTQVSLHSCETDDIMLPPTTRAIKDLHLSPHNNGLAVFGSLGKRLSVLSLESHNTVVSYDLPAAPWSCSWDLDSSHHIYAGLQNGMVLVFDMRQTVGPVTMLTGLTTNPVHTIHHLSANSTPTSSVRGLLSASSIGLCHWKTDGSEERPFLVSEPENPAVCISSSYCPRSNHVVASYRPKVQASDDTMLTQPSLTPSGVSSSSSNGIEGVHVCLKRIGNDSYQKLSSTQASVDSIRLPRTAIIDLGKERNQLFASCDESTRQIILQEPSSFRVSQRFHLTSHHQPLQDVKYMNVNGVGLLGLLTDDRLQLLRN